MMKEILARNPPATPGASGAQDFLYNVATQCGEGKPIYVGQFTAAEDLELEKFVCRVFGLKSTDEFTLLEIHKHMPEGRILVVREVDKWPTGVSVIHNKGVTHPRPITQNRAPAIIDTTPPWRSSQTSPTARQPVIVEHKIDEAKIPINKYKAVKEAV